MAEGLGVTPEEWEYLRKQVNDSFWVMRAIGDTIVFRSLTPYLWSSHFQAIRHFLILMMVFLVAHIGKCLPETVPQAIS